MLSCNFVGYLFCCSANHKVVLVVVLCLVCSDKEGGEDGSNTIQMWMVIIMGSQHLVHLVNGQHKVVKGVAREKHIACDHEQQDVVGLCKCRGAAVTAQQRTNRLLSLLWVAIVLRNRISSSTALEVSNPFERVGIIPNDTVHAYISMCTEEIKRTRRKTLLNFSK